MIIQNFDDFTKAILQFGFSMGGSNSEGIFSLSSLYGNNILWHTEDTETDPWEWRMRVLNERNDIAYSKLFFNKSGFITKEWYPYFLSIRRDIKTFDMEYSDGTMSNTAKRIYDIICENDSLPLHKIKRLGDFSKDDNSHFEKALVELQMKMYITMCGRAKKMSKYGEEYGWSSTVLCTSEAFWGNEVFEKSSKINKQEAINKITEQIYKINPAANTKKINRFING